MSDLTPTETPDYKNAEHTEMAGGWELVNDLRKGQRHMRALGVKYLPKNTIEAEKKYKNRLSMSRFYNVYRHTEEALLGLAFRKDPVLGTDVPVAIRGRAGKRRSGLAENIDGQGTHIALFLRQALKHAFDGHSFIHVEMPPPLPKGSSRADELKAGRLPYWRHYRAEQALNWDVETLPNGVPRLKQISFLERVQRPDGRFGKKFVRQFRVLLPGGWELWEESNATGTLKVTKQSDGEVSITNEIPLAVIYGHKMGALLSQPPLEDLAWENVYHYQLCSKFRYSADVALTPIMARIGARTDEQNKPLAFSVDKIIDVNVGGDAKWVETEARAIPHARTEIKDSEARMAVIGMSLVAGRPEVDVTATKSVLDNVEQTSSLGLMVRSLADGGERALGWTAFYLDAGRDGGSLNVNKNFTHLQLDPQKMTALSGMVADGNLSVETLWEIMRRAEELPDEFDAVEEAKRIARANALAGNPANERPLEGEKAKPEDKSKGGGTGDDHTDPAEQ